MRNYIDTAVGRLHYSEEGSGEVVILLLHQTPRSLDEFAEVQPLLGRTHRVIAMDMLGFGLSPAVRSPHSIELMASGGWALLDALGVDRPILLGHHTGAAVAMEMAASEPDGVRALVLSSPPWTGPEFRMRHADGPGVDDAVPRADGSHLLELWGKRAPFYPANRPGILDRFIRDALAPGLDPVEGHRACARYEMEHRIEQIICPVLLIGASEDPFAMPDLPRVREALTNARSVDEVIVTGGRIPLMEEFPAEVCDAVINFLRDAIAA